MGHQMMDKQPPPEFKSFKFGNHDEKNSSFGRSDGFNFGVRSSTSAANSSTSTSRHQFTFDTAPTGNDSGFRFNLDHVTKKPSAPFVFGEAKTELSSSTTTSTAFIFGNNDKKKKKKSSSRGIIVKSADSSSPSGGVFTFGQSLSHTSNNNAGVCEINNILQNMNTADVEETVSICANCGKEGIDVNNICNKCQSVMYCNALCKKKHRHKHKKECEEHVRLAAEHTDKLHDEKLFKQPPPLDCPICFLCLPSPSLGMGYIYQTCCGKLICCGCIHAPVYDHLGNKVDNQKCPFCRTPTPTSEVQMNEIEIKRAEVGDAQAIFSLGCYYRDGISGYPQDNKKALELYLRAGELGHAKAYCNIGGAYFCGNGVEIDKEKAMHYFELAAMGGDFSARYNLGYNEARGGNLERALKHHMIAVRGGYNPSLEMIKKLYTSSCITKDDYTKALQLFQEYLGEIKSKQRDEAAAAQEDYRYY